MFKTLGIEPIQLSGCEFENLYRVGIEHGTDVCIHTEGDTKCTDCKYGKIEDEYYPEVPDTFYLIVIALLSSRGISVYGSSLKEIRKHVEDAIDILDFNNKTYLRDWIYDNITIQGRPWRYYVERNKQVI